MPRIRRALSEAGGAPALQVGPGCRLPSVRSLQRCFVALKRHAWDQIELLMGQFGYALNVGFATEAAAASIERASAAAGITRESEKLIGPEHDRISSIR